jgi:tetratricopeptide (TPR) repeat protein
MSERALLAAQGYLELGMVEEALSELASVPAGENADADLTELRLHILMHGKRWDEALVTAEELLRISPQAVPGYIHGAFALHELGRTAEARDLLLKGPPLLRQNPTFHYNIGCYEAVLGNRESALQSLRESFALDETYRDFAQRDPDLEGIRDALVS